MAITDLIIVGYPKSGNTWVTRLVAELVQCPVAGFWDSDHKEIAQEGSDRVSEYRCFKSHHQLHELRTSGVTEDAKVIYVMRDPRDIAVSGAHYFLIDRWPSLARFFARFPRGNRIYRRHVNPVITPVSFRLEKMVRAVLLGLEEVHRWVRIPWKTHYEPYLDNEFFFVKYEDLLSQPEHECERILAFLTLRRTDEQIEGAIRNQSFEKKKETFQASNESAKAKFMRVGKSGRWRQELSDMQKKMFEETLSNELRHFSYSTDSDAE